MRVEGGGTAHEQVVAAASVQHVRAGAADQRIRAAAAHEGVVAGAANEDDAGGHGAGVERVIAGAAEDHHLACRREGALALAVNHHFAGTIFADGGDADLVVDVRSGDHQDSALEFGGHNGDIGRGGRADAVVLVGRGR